MPCVTGRLAVCYDSDVGLGAPVRRVFHLTGRSRVAGASASPTLARLTWLSIEA